MFAHPPYWTCCININNVPRENKIDLDSYRYNQAHSRRGIYLTVSCASWSTSTFGGTIVLCRRNLSLHGKSGGYSRWAWRVTKYKSNATRTLSIKYGAVNVKGKIVHHAHEIATWWHVSSNLSYALELSGLWSSGGEE